jgi:hypothetical protein
LKKNSVSKNLQKFEKKFDWKYSINWNSQSIEIQPTKILAPGSKIAFLLRFRLTDIRLRCKWLVETNISVYHSMLLFSSPTCDIEQYLAKILVLHDIEWYYCPFSFNCDQFHNFAPWLLKFSKIFSNISDSFELQTFQTHNTKMMLKDKKVKNALTYHSNIMANTCLLHLKMICQIRLSKFDQKMMTRDID